MPLGAWRIPLSEGIIDMPSPDQKGAWSEMHEERISTARKVIEDSESVAATLVRDEAGSPSK